MKTATDSPRVRTALRLGLLSLCTSLLLTMVIAIINGFVKELLYASRSWLDWMPILVMLTIMVTACASAVLNTLNAMLRPAPIRAASGLAHASVAILVGVETISRLDSMPVGFYFAASLFAHTLYTGSLVTIMSSTLRLAGSWASLPAFYAAGSIVSFGVLGYIGQSWISLKSIALILPLVRDLASLIYPLLVLAACSFYRPLRLEQSSALASIAMRLPIASAMRPQRRALALITLGILLGTVANFALHARAGGSLQGVANLMSLAFVPLSWFGVLLFGIYDLVGFAGERQQGSFTARLAPNSAKRFLARHLLDRQSWAATVGLKTSKFHFDHDPGSYLEEHLPAALNQIRAEEIQRCIDGLLGPLQLHSHAGGHRIFGAIDAETAVRPCVEALKMFACLYLDAGPLVERRLKCLSALLPIVDPGLARLVRPEGVGTLIRRSHWYFELDFAWLDQHLVHTPHATRYDVRMSTLSPSLREHMLNHLEKSGGAGNFVWIGPHARDRLLQEAPMLRHVIEACPVSTGRGHDEFLMFLVKFEHLIPRLQRYFGLDTMRQALADFEPSSESLRLSRLFSLQLTKGNSVSEILDTLSSISSVPWRGFKEKDEALQLVLQAYHVLNRLLGLNIDLATSDDPHHRPLLAHLLEAVTTVGYPSQLLHNAHISKIALRDFEALNRAAMDPGHARFHEAWLLLATTDYSRHSAGHRLEIAQLLQLAASKQSLAANPLVQAKACDTLASIARTPELQEVAILNATLNTLADWYMGQNADPEIFSLLLDTEAFMISLFPNQIGFNLQTMQKLAGTIQKLTTAFAPTNPKIVGLLSRWQELQARVAMHSGTIPPTNAA